MWVVGDGAVCRSVRSAGPGVEIRCGRSIAALGFDTRPPGVRDLLIVSVDAGGSTLAAQVARWTPYVTVVLLVPDVGRLLDFQAEYLATAATDLRTDPRAGVHVLLGAATGRRLGQVVARHLDSARAAPAGPPRPAASRELVSPYRPLRRDERPVILAVQGCAGGVGASTLATVLAAAVARRERVRRICVIEAGDDHRTASGICGDVLAARAPRWMPELRIHTVAHPGAAGLIGNASAGLWRTLAQRFDVLIVDCTASLPLLPADLPVDRLLLVTTLVKPSLAGLRHRAGVLRVRASALGDAAPWVGVVVNGAMNGLGFDPEDVVDAALGAPIIAAVPHAARDVAVATNRGRLDELLDHPDLGPVYRNLAEFGVPPLPAEPASGPLQPRRRRRWRRGTHGSSPFVVEPADAHDAG